ncbi:MAG: DUF58 domain-containing protein [Pseudomonadota bacterium]
MLTPELIKKIKRIHIKSGRTVNTMMAGRFASVYRGSGMEFEEVREYSPGDEIGSIDWKVTARMGRPFVKLFREERELVIMLLVDMSASGLFGTTDSLKREVAAEIASLLAFSAIKNNDKVGAILFTDRVEKYIPPKKGSSHVWRVIKEIVSFAPQYRGTNLGAAAEFLAKTSRKRGIAFIISDFLAEGWLKPVKQAARRHDLAAVVVHDPGDFNLPEAGLLHFRDLETGRVRLIDCSDRRTREQFSSQRRAAHQQVLADLKSGKIDCIELGTDGSSADALISFFRQRERRSR